MSNGFTTGMRSSLSDEWTTPRYLFDELDKEFGFTLDAAALASSTLCKEWFGPDHPDSNRRDALINSWATSGTVWLNPPYGRAIKSFMAKANAEAQSGVQVVCLVPSRTDTNWWWDSVMHHEVRFIKGRVRFGGNKPAPFPSALVIMK